MWAESCVTFSGLELLVEWAAGGKKLYIDGARAGTGTYPAASLMNSVRLKDERQILSIIEARRNGNSTNFHIQIIAPETGYTANQIGIWAHLDNGPSTMLAIYQDPAGVTVPSSQEMPEFVYAFYADVELDNTGELSVNIDTNVLVSMDTLNRTRPWILDANIPVASWKGTGPYTTVLEDKRITEKTGMIYGCWENGTDKNQATVIEWETAPGTITLTTKQKPTGALTGYMILTEVLSE